MPHGQRAIDKRVGHLAFSIADDVRKWFPIHHAFVPVQPLVRPVAGYERLEAPIPDEDAVLPSIRPFDHLPQNQPATVDWMAAQCPPRGRRQRLSLDQRFQQRGGRGHAFARYPTLTLLLIAPRGRPIPNRPQCALSCAIR